MVTNSGHTHAPTHTHTDTTMAHTPFCLFINLVRVYLIVCVCACIFVWKKSVLLCCVAVCVTRMRSKDPYIPLPQSVRDWTVPHPPSHGEKLTYEAFCNKLHEFSRAVLKEGGWGERGCTLYTEVVIDREGFGALSTKCKIAAQQQSRNPRPVRVCMRVCACVRHLNHHYNFHLVSNWWVLSTACLIHPVYTVCTDGRRACRG